MTIPPPGPLAYQGQVVVPFIDRTFAPTSSNNDFMVPTLWVNTTSKTAYLLTAKPLGVANWVNLGASSSSGLVTLTGDTGGALTGDSSQNINILGTAGQITVTGSGHTLTLALAGGGEAIDSFIPDSGTSPVVPAANGSVTMSGSGSITTVGGTNTLTTQLTGLTSHSVLVGAGTSTITKVGPSATTGAPMISGGAAADPGFSTTFTILDATPITTLSKASAGSVVTFSTQNTSTNTALISSTANSAGNGAGYFSSGQYDTTKYWNFGMVPTNAGTNAGGYNISYNTVGQSDPSGGTVMLTVATTGDVKATTGDLGDQRSGVGVNITTFVDNTDNTNAGSSARLSASVGGSSAGDPYIQLGIAGATLNKFGLDNSASDAFVYNTGANGGTAGLDGTTRFQIAQTGAITFNNAFTFPTADGTAGQVLTTNGAGTVTWSSSGVGTWTDTSGVFTASRNSAYFLTAASTATLPASPAQGDTVDFVCDTTGSCVITGNTGQFIRIANQLSSAAGTATNSARGDTLSLVYRAATTTWFAFDAPNGGWTTA